MRLSMPVAAIAVLFSLGTANAALQTDAYDPVETEVITREAALTGATKDEKKLQKAYTKVMKVFAKDSDSRKKDAKAIKKINKLLGKAWADDVDGMALIDTSMEAFLAEIDAQMVQCERCNDLIAEGNKHRNKAVKGSEDANQFLGLARNEDTLKARTKWMLKAEKTATKAHGASLDGLELEDITPHEQAFLLDRPMGYSGPSDCTECHSKEIGEVRNSFHFQWEYTTDQVEGHETDTHGKRDILNNFCIAIPSNEPRCTQCHVGYGWKDATFDHDTAAVDCMVCHDTTGTYKKDKKTAGSIMAGIDMTDVVIKAGEPSRQTCGACHYFAGGGDNVKHGDLASSLTNTTREFDVHMGTDGGDMACQACHKNEGDYDHTTPGHGLTSAEGDIACENCHTAAPHQSGTYNNHTDKIACQTCHIPAFSRSMPTKMVWEWETAGQGLPVTTDQYGKPEYDNMKGNFEWGKAVTPELAWFNGKWRRAFIGDSDTYTSLPVMLAEPVGDKDDAAAKLYPFKVMKGNQIADTGNQRIITPHLFGTATGYYPFWGKWSWALSIAEGAIASEVPYSGQFGFVDTEMYMSLNHEIAPAAEALTCGDCHGSPGLDWDALGYDENPYDL